MIFLEKDGTLINTAPDNLYYTKVLKFKEAWESDQQNFTIHTSGSTGIPNLSRLHVHN